MKNISGMKIWTLSHDELLSKESSRYHEGYRIVGNPVGNYLRFFELCRAIPVELELGFKLQCELVYFFSAIKLENGKYIIGDLNSFSCPDCNAVTIFLDIDEPTIYVCVDDPSHMKNTAREHSIPLGCENCGFRHEAKLTVWNRTVFLT